MVVGVIYLVYLYRTDPRRVLEVGLVHLDPLEEHDMSDPQVISFRPRPDQYAWTFGGAAPVARVRPPAVLEVFTEDCFAGRVRSETDLVSEVCEFPYLNPQTGPFYIEGAEPGDTLAVHFISIEPARDWGASTTVPLFGALSATHVTALLHDPLPELVWLWQFDTAKGLPVHRPARRFHRGPADRARCTARSGWPRPTWRCAAPWSRTRSAATWTPRRCAPGSPATWG